MAGDGTLSQSTSTSTGTPNNTGPVISVTVITCVADVGLPHSSVAVQVRVNVDRQCHASGERAGLCKTPSGIEIQLSVAVTVAGDGKL